MDIVKRKKLFDNHSHIGPVPGFAYYGLPEAVKPTTDYQTAEGYIKGMDKHKVDRALVMSNYGYPDSAQPFELNPLVAEGAQTSHDRLLGAIWVSALPKDKERTREALKLIGEKGLIALKTTCLLGGTFDPEQWDEESAELWKMILDAGAEHDMPLHIHTSPGGGSDIDNALALIKQYGKSNKIHVVHMGGGVSGHIKFVPRFFELIEEGYQVYTDSSWAVGFGSAWILKEIEERGIGADRFLFGSDIPWSDFASEYWKIEGADISEELKENIFWNNAEKLYSRFW
ncbi:MAG: amidohydrolase family protein [Candidatus Dadabacteria bacterium]|nr:amidohydrolase family protein [Candidatus Dadabacteria bacterium]